MTARPARRARWAFWMLVLLAVLLTGALGKLLRAPPSPGVGLAVAVVGLLTVVILALAARVLLALAGQLTAQPRTRQPSGDRAGRPTPGRRTTR
ncbi:MAG TPA: hypothetical protein VFR23_26070 [Jiangellaceae bacterium]|nr:hypothetical protein [Jiangellaceae bacterium]